MTLRKSDCRVETMRGTGPGGQHRNKTNSAVRITHLPSGVSAYADERSQRHSKKRAWADLERKLSAIKTDAAAAAKKARRDAVIHDRTVVRTYNFPRSTAKDHRTGKTASLDDILRKGKLELLR